jgi:tRNA (guanine37-N1)-methyltransferase
MRLDLITVLPELLHSPFNHSIVKRAQEKGLAEIQIHNLRDFSKNKYKQVDDYPYGGAAGMVLMAEPLSDCIEKLKSERSYDQIIFMTPDGTPAKQTMVNSLSLCQNLMIICGHYKGIDHRIRDLYVDLEICIGDFVVTGGELPAAMLVDGIVRLLPGVIGNEESALSDSFQDGLLSPPVYTRPAEFKGLKVPEVLLSGDPSKILAWQMDEAERITQQKRPDLLA